MKIVLVSRFPRDSDNPRGGVETATVGLAKALRDYTDHDIHIVTLEKNISGPIVENHEQLTVHRLKRSPVPMFIDVFNGPSSIRLRRYLYLLAPDIVHFHETWGFGSRKLKIPNVFTVHGFDSLNLPTEKQMGWRVRAKIWQFFEAFAMRRQRNLISIAPYVHEQIKPLTSAKIFDIWNPIDKSLFELDRSEQFPTILFLGWLNPRKNPLAIVEAVALIKSDFPEIRVRLCGEASDQQYYSELVQRIKSLGLENNIDLPGRLAQSEVKEELSKASVMVLPSYQENAPMAISEAMAAGVPVIASNLCGVPDMLTDGGSGILINPDKVDTIVNALTAILSDDVRRKKMGASAKQDSRRRFHPQSVAEATMNCYSQVINVFPKPGL